MRNYKAGEFAKLIGIALRTLQRWDNEKKLVAYRTPTGRRYYTQAQLDQCLGVTVGTEEAKGRHGKKKTVAYCRVSNQGQKDDLKNQVDFLKTYAIKNGITLDAIYTDIGSGLNYKRKQWNQLLEESQAGDIGMVLIAHKDRFIRFGYDWFAKFLRKNGTEIHIANNIALSPEQELIQDLINIIHVFSCRIYGLRKYRKKVKDELC